MSAARAVEGAAQAMLAATSAREIRCSNRMRASASGVCDHTRRHWRPAGWKGEGQKKPGTVGRALLLPDDSANLQHQLPIGPADEQEQNFVPPGYLLHFFQVTYAYAVDSDDDV